MVGVAAGAEKCRLAKENGYAEVIDRTREDIVERVKAITGGAGVPVVYDSVGKATFDASLKCLRPRGYFVSFEARRSLTSGVADEWYPVTPGSEGLVALALWPATATVTPAAVAHK